ncbi:hypothetical protein GCM10009792_19450 [Microcella alkalica]|uniref:Thiol-disulfide isomerase/thioredoxin n=1 Tax=Microcella alkalica TaxID=355930 RepID=A0A839E7Y6_9MICO|nr:thioredoxin family protein [Microcella alkalica]MBA8848631.1 thiol-disulfide isomerase/thioredoxin [Microcella alkalica]
MSALPRPAAAAALALAAGLLLAGCAAGDPSAAPEPAASSSPTTSGGGEATESPSAESESEGGGDGGDAVDPGTAQPGAYVDYRDGVIGETPGTKALFFHAPWCTQCRALEQSILEGEIPVGLTIIKADFDSETALRQQYGVTLQTTIVYVGDEGESLGSTVLYDDTTLDALVAAAP